MKLSYSCTFKQYYKFL